MAPFEEEIPRTVLPERLGRRLRLGPFPSSRDALKFVVYAAVGAMLVPFSGPYVWLAVAIVGFAIAVWQPEGSAIDERALAIVRWGFRRHFSRARPMTVGRDAGEAVLRLPSGSAAAVLRAGGVPLAYLPPIELQRRFERYRELLRSLEGSFAWYAGTVPLRTAGLLPAPRPEGEPEHWGRDGYRGLVGVLCRRRGVRRVDWVLGSVGSGPQGLPDLERRVRLVEAHLAGCGVGTVRLSGRSLRDAARRLGWTPEGSVP